MPPNATVLVQPLLSHPTPALQVWLKAATQHPGTWRWEVGEGRKRVCVIEG